MTRQIRLLGTLSITNGGEPSRLLSNGKGCALLAYLIVRGRPVNREQLADLFWDASSTAEGLRNLRVLLTRIRPFLPGLDAGRSMLAYTPPPDEQIDYLHLTAVLEQGEGRPLLEGLRFYQGDLLDGFYLEDAPRFQEWLTLERERLRRTVYDAYGRLCRSLAAGQQWQEGIEAAAHWLALDNLAEEAVRQLMQFQAAAGQTAAALAEYEQFRARLRHELELDPEPATQALAAKLRDAYHQATTGLYEGMDFTVQLTWPERGTLAAPGLLPPAALVPFRRNPDFTGRAAELLELAERLLPWPDAPPPSVPPVAIVTGMGGLGKSQLAVEFAYRYGRYFPGGVFWLNFGADGQVAEEVAAVGTAQGLGLFDEAEKLSLADQVGRVQRAWQEPVPRLLIFDNCEAEKLLATWLPVTGGCRVLVTSRRGEWGRTLGATLLSLDPLAPAESSEFLRQQAPHLTAAEAQAIGEEIGHLPLALHLAGGFLNRYRQVSAAAYLAQLRDIGLLEHPSFQGRGATPSPTGHELNVARTFTLNLDQLDPDDEVGGMARRLLTYAACFAAGEALPQDLLRAVINDDDLMTVLLVEDGLGRLVSLGFLEAEGRESVVLHRLLAAFVQKEMAAGTTLEAAQTAVENSVVARLTPHLKRARAYGLPPLPIPHLRHVTETALRRGSAAAAPLALTLGRYLRELGEYASAQACLEKGLAIANAGADIYNQGRILSILARAYYSQGFHPEAQQSALEAVRLLRLADQPDSEWLTVALVREGWANLRLGRAAEALAVTTEAKALSVRVHNRAALADCLNLLGSIQYFLLGEYQAADLSFTEARALYHELGHRSAEATVVMNQAESANTQGDYGRAEATIQEALTLIRASGDRMKELSMLINLAEVQVRAGAYEPAVTSLTQVIAEAPPNWTYAPVAYQVLAEGYLGLGQVEQALAAVQSAGALEQSQADPFSSGQVWRVLGLIAAQLGRPVAGPSAGDASYTAAQCFAQSLRLFTEIGNRRERAYVLWQWANYAFAQGNTAEGQAMWQEARDIFGRLNLPLLIARMDQTSGR